MSRTANLYQAQRWLLTAKEDLAAAETLFHGEKYAQACFLSQQAGEKAVKSIWYAIDADPWGHSIMRLIADFPGKDEIDDLHEWIEQANLLDKFYIPTRYPNGLPDLTPGQVYGKADAQAGLNAAGYLINACDRWIEAQTYQSSK
jgi:HEPN domain-containing protein